MHQFKTRILRYIEPSKCYSSEAELTNAKRKKLKVDANTLAMKTIPDESVLTAYQLQRCFVVVDWTMSLQASFRSLSMSATSRH